MSQTSDAERHRLSEDSRREKNWKRWGPYLSERQWGTVREDYSENGSCWEYFPHDHARSRTYRWGEDGLLGICDREGRLCFSFSLWNEADAILKERAFGLTNSEGNHGEDLKEYYFYLDATPTHSYLKALYKYPQRAFPYLRLLEEARRRGREQPEFELLDTGIFEQNRYFDVQVEYAKQSPNDILIRISLDNRGSESAPLHFLPTLWFRNTWSWGRHGEGYWPKPQIGLGAPREIIADHASLGRFRLAWDSTETEAKPLFTDNETNVQRLYGVPNQRPWVKDAFDRYVVRREHAAVNPSRTGTKAGLHHLWRIPGGARQTLRLRLFADSEAPAERFGQSFDQTFEQRINEADEFFAARLNAHLTDEERRVSRQAYAGLLWSKQFYHYDLRSWLEGDPPNPPPARRKHGRNADWTHLYNRDVVSVPDNWEYPWYAAWDFAFHMLPFARLDPHFAKEQLVLFLREWYMHPNGQLPAYEFEFSDVNPPVHAWAAWRVYKIAAERGSRDRHFLARVFQKLLLNFTWWVNRKDAGGKHLFSGGFLGLDNIGVFDRSRPLPGGGRLEQADGTAWMAFFCATMLSIALELARDEPAYDDMASKFFEHFVAIADAMNWLGG
ncbi:MAG TPA: glucosidase, partial [Myxococcaceae bacterium]|nr:glucosidase [Myxococcaceae bacterium]